MHTGSLNLTWARALVGALFQAGIRHACISPGSRSTSLTLAVAEHPDIATTVHIDERSAAFFALGYARGTGRPAMLICTSGTAGANYYPAIIEASQARVPMIALTADRPPELRDTGAWQTIDQVKLFGGYARWFCEMATPTEGQGALRYAREVARRAFHTALAPIPGPVHINCAFREPLSPPQDVLHSGPERSQEADGFGASAAGSESPSGGPSRFEALLGRARRPRPEETHELLESIRHAPRGLILAGQMSPREILPSQNGDQSSPTSETEDEAQNYRHRLTALSELIGYPILAEPAGGLRFGQHDGSRVITGHEAFLRAPLWRDAHPPQLVLRFGASLTWKYVAQYLEAHPSAQQVIVDPLERRDDPTRSGARWLAVDPSELLSSLVSNPRGRSDPARSGAEVERLGSDRDEANLAWLRSWQIARDKSRAVIGDLSRYEHSEGTVAWVYPTLFDWLPDGALVYAANSMAVRDVDTFTGGMAKRIDVLVNRGAAGIDGTLSSALGAALGSGRPTTLVTGDLAFLHDLNGLGARGAEGADLEVIVLNDRGGGIFSHLPIAAGGTASFEPYFRTPHAADLEAACRAYRVPHRSAADPRAFIDILDDGASTGGLRVVEIPVDMVVNTVLHQRIWREVAARLS